MKACDKVCGKKLIRKNREGTWWWNEEVKKAEKKIEAFSKSSNKTFKFLKTIKKGKDVEGGKRIRDIDGRLAVNDINKKEYGNNTRRRS